MCDSSVICMSANTADSSKVLNSLADGVVVRDAETWAIERVNDSFCEMVEFEREELVGTNVHLIDAGPPLGEDETPEELIKQARNEGAVTFERRMETQTGEVLPVEIHLSCLADEDSLVATVREIQTRKEHQQRLDRYKQLVEQAPEMMIGLKTDGELLFANELFRQRFDIGDQSVAGLTAENVLSAEQNETFQPVLDSVFAGDTVNRTVQRTTQEGDDHWYHIQSYPLDEPGEMDDSIVVMIDDITERKRHKQTVRDQQAFIQSTIDALNDVFYVFNTEGTLVEYNDRLPEVTGYDPDELAEMQPWEFFPADERPLIKHAIANVLHNERAERTEGHFITKSDEDIPYEFSATPYYDGTGAVAGFVGIGRDITERKELEIQQRRYQQAIESSGDLLAALDDEGNYLFANQAYCEYHRLGDAQVRGRSARQVIGHEQYETVEPYLEAALDGETTHYEMNRVHPDRGERTIDIRYYPLYDQDSRIQGVVAAMRDITERKERERELTRFKEAIEQTGHAVCFTDTDGTLEYVNPAFEDLTEYSRDEVQGENPSILQSGEHDDEFYQNMWETITSGQVWEGTIIDQRKSGTQYRAHQTIAPVTHEGSTLGFVAVQNEITDKQLRKEHVSVMHRILRHNLRNDLNVIYGHAEQLQQSVEKDTQRSHVRKIAEQAEKLESLIDKIRTGKDTLEQLSPPFKTVPVSELYDDVITSLGDEASEATIMLECPSKDPVYVPERLKPALRELFENALRHTENAAPSITLEVNVDTETERVSLTVADDGQGIPDVVCKTLKQGQETDLQHLTGVGFWLVKWIVTALGGTLEIKTDDVTGSQVTLTTPLEPSRTVENR